MGTDRLHMMAGPADPSDPAARARYRDAPAFLCDAAGFAGIAVLIEPPNPRGMPGNFPRSFDQAAGVIADIRMPNPHLRFDICHRQIIQGDVLTGLPRFLPFSGRVQIASGPDRQQPDTGALDDRRILNEPFDLGCQGFVGCGYRPAGDTVAGLGWRDSLSAARRVT